MKPKIAIIGLGYVGLPLAVCFGKKYPTIGFDISSERINNLSVGLDSTNECTSEMIDSAKYLIFTDDDNALLDVDIYIITVPTPIDDSNRPNLDPIKEASKLVGSRISKGNIIIYESTVYPGATEEVCIPILEQQSGLIFDKDFGCGYSPERINPGDKVHTLEKITKIVSGSSKKILEEISKLYSSIIEAGVWEAESIKVAEAAKVIENCQRDLNIAFVNELSLIFERLNIDTEQVLDAAGTKWNFLPYRPGMVGGHCIGVDPYYLTHKAEMVGYNPQVILAGRRINDNMAKYSARAIIKMMISNGINVHNSNVGILGITFKENCPDIRNSKIVDLIKELESWHINTLVHDPIADKKEVKSVLKIELSDLDKFSNLDALVIAVKHDKYASMSLSHLAGLCKKGAVLGDIKSLKDKKEAERLGLKVFRL